MKPPFINMKVNLKALFLLHDIVSLSSEMCSGTSKIDFTTPQ